MPKITGKTTRIWGSVPAETEEKLNIWAKKLGIARSALIAMCVQAGLNAIIRGIEPESAFTTDQWARILNKIQEEGEK